MKSCQRCSLPNRLLLVVIGRALISLAMGSPLGPEPQPGAEYHDEAKLIVLQDNDDSIAVDLKPPPVDQSKFVVITEDVIPDVENTTQKVIRVNPLDAPSVRDDSSGSTDSSLYKIKGLIPANRKYVNSNRMRKQRPLSIATEDSPIIRQLPSDSKVQKLKHQQKKKHLHFLYNQDNLEGQAVSKTMRVHVAPGAYPVYYAVAKTNGRFGKFPIKGFRNRADFMKYLMRSKAHPIDEAQRFES